MDQSIEAILRKFMLRRAFRAGKVKREDASIAFKEAGLDIKLVRLTQLMTKITKQKPKILERKGRTIYPALCASEPEEASEEDLMSAIFSGDTRFIRTGLTSKELPIEQVRWTTNTPQSKGSFKAIANALSKRRCLHIHYIGLKKGDKGSHRIVEPVGLQSLGDQWRLIAYDLQKDEPVQQAFTLSRIILAKEVDKRVKLSRHRSFDAIEETEITLNAELTKEQKQTLKHEMNIVDGQVKLPPNGIFELKRRYGDVPVSDSIVWPLIKD